MFDLVFVLLLGAFLCRLAKTGLDTKVEFLVSMQAESLAHAGAVVAIVRLKNDGEFPNLLESGMINYRNPFISGVGGDFTVRRYEVYAAQRENDFVFLSLDTVSAGRRQVIVEVRFGEDGFLQV